MKRNDQPSFYYSAYPLKAIGQISSNTGDQSPFLNNIASGKTKTLSRVRVSAMSNPYQENVRPISTSIGKIEKEIEPTNSEWFNNFE